MHTGPYLVRLYYRLMGASIGRNVTIHKDAKLGQADLLTIGEDTYTSYIFTSSYWILRTLIHPFIHAYLSILHSYMIQLV